jgi:hypothetical protein
MNGRDLERALVALGAGQTSVDTVLRKLRAAGLFPVGGRGFNAPTITARDAAAALAAFAGSATASEADERLGDISRLRSLEPRPSDETFLDAFAKLLESPTATAQILEVRIGKNVNRADIWSREGVLRFGTGTAGALGAAMYRAEGVLPGPLLNYIARLLAGETEPPKYHYVRFRS